MKARLQKINSLIDGNKREYNVTIIMIKSSYSMTDIIRIISNQKRLQRLKRGENNGN